MAMATKPRKMPRKGASIKPQTSALTCPKCESKEVKYVGLDTRLLGLYDVYERASCVSCRFKWMDHYQRVRQVVGWM